MPTCRCGHPDVEHPLKHPCRGQIHYPSEDYPCTCEDFATDAAGNCKECGHKADQHGPLQRCRSAGCRCMRFSEAAQ